VTGLTPDVQRLFEGPNYGHLATLMPDGSPHSVALWVGVEDGRVVFFTQPSSRKARNLEGDPRVAISVTAHDQPFTMASIRGRVVERLDGDPGWEIIDRLAHKYIGQPYDRSLDRVAFLVEPDHAWGQAFG
jgi:PPOX class probable F420-dependent enzyme